MPEKSPVQEPVGTPVFEEASLKSKELINIVPLHVTKPHLDLTTLTKEDADLFKVSKEASSAPPPKLVYNGGRLIQKVEVYTIFWGAHWAHTHSYVNLATKINSFFSAVLVSPLIDQLTEYNTPQYKINHGTLRGTKTITAGAPAPGSSITDSKIQHALNGWIAAHTVPPPDANSLYFIYTDVNVKVVMGGSASCVNFCGYHSNVGNTFYAVMPFPGCPGCLGGLNAFDALTGTSSHELCEAITDAIPGTGWYDNFNGEIGDICAWQFKKVAGYNVQLEWSNKANKCV